MNLKIQIISMSFSFLFGVLFGGAVIFNYKYLFLVKRKKRIIYNIVFMLIMSFSYFFYLKQINEGILHPHFLILFLGGWYIGANGAKKIKK